MIKKTKFKDLVIHINKPYRDKRGYLKELLSENKIKKKFVVSILSFSKKNVLRGLHFQTKNPQGKYVTVIKGKIFDVAVDLRKNSKTFGKHFSCILSEFNYKSIYIPPGFAHGYYVISEKSIFHYKCTNYYDPNDEYGIAWDDPLLNIDWPEGEKNISKKDLDLPFLSKINSKNLPKYNTL